MFSQTMYLTKLSNKVVKIDGKDAPWMTEFIKLKIQCPNSIYKTFQNSSQNLA